MTSVLHNRPDWLMRVLAVREVWKNQPRSKKEKSVFRNIDIRIMCEYPHAQAAGPKNILKAFFHKRLDATFFKLYFAFSSFSLCINLFSS